MATTEKNEEQFAIIKTGGKQYKVKVGQKIKVEKLTADNSLDFIDLLENKKVQAKVTGTGKLEKIMILKQQAKKRYKRINGHRQEYSEIQIIKIS